MKLMVCTGDSHAYGQGAAGAVLSPPIECGDRRFLPLDCGGYVSGLRAFVNARTGAASTQEQSLPLPFSRRVRAGAVRLLLRAVTPGQAAVAVDGAARLIDLTASAGEQYAPVFLRLDGGAQERLIEVAMTRGEAVIHQMELYQGPAAVINCGIGSCPLGRYLERYFDTYVSSLKPDFVLLSTHTINDWRVGETETEFAGHVRRAIRRVREIGAKGAIVSVMPILGPQRSPVSGLEYGRLHQSAAAAAREERFALIDAYAAFEEAMRGMSEEARRIAYYSDDWHPNQAGHQLYEELICRYLSSNDSAV